LGNEELLNALQSASALTMVTLFVPERALLDTSTKHLQLRAVAASLMAVRVAQRRKVQEQESIRRMVASVANKGRTVQRRGQLQVGT
jgi:hypothetical protein